MGAFFLTNKNHNYNHRAVQNLFVEKGFSEPSIYEAGNWNLYYFGKIAGLPKQVISRNGHTVVVCGTFVYRSKNALGSLESYFNDLLESKTDAEEIIGDHAIIHISTSGKMLIKTSASNIYNVFYDDSSQLWSSSFLAIKAARSKNTLHQFAAIENVISGNVIGADTLIAEIKRLEPGTTLGFENLEIKVGEAQKPKAFFKGTIYEAVDYQLAVLEKYFRSTKAFADEAGADSGLTSGFDSRLILSQMLKYWSNFQVHGHYRKKKDSELSISEKVADAMSLKMVQIPAEPPLDLTDDQLQERLRKSYIFTDGIVRMHGFWTEDYNTAQHRLDVLGNKKLGISGIGGEQYRNMDHLFWDKYNFRNFVKYKTVYALSGSIFSDEKAEEDFFDYLTAKIAAKLNITGNTIGKLEVKRYWNEVFIPARLGHRNNAENQVSYFLSPFIEDRVAKAAYEIIPQLGISHRFQMLMIERTNAKLASVQSDYGFSFDKKIPVKEIVKAYIKAVTPDIISQKRMDKIINCRTTDYFDALVNKSSGLKSAYITFAESAFPVKEKMLIKQPDLMPLTLQMGYFINSI